MESGREFVQGIQRGFAVLRAFGATTRSMTIAQVAHQTGLTRAVARRYLLTLRDLGYVSQKGTTFELTARVLELGATYLATIDVVHVAEPILEQVVEKAHESCSVAVMEGRDVIYVARVSAKRIMTTNLAIGSRLPAHATSLGKVLLAYLPPVQLDDFLAARPLAPLTPRTLTSEEALRKALAAVREHGWAVSDSEVEEGVRSVAAPVFDRAGQVTAAVNLSGHASRVTRRHLTQVHLPLLLEAARQISRGLGYMHAGVRTPGVRPGTSRKRS